MMVHSTLLFPTNKEVLMNIIDQFCTKEYNVSLKSVEKISCSLLKFKNKNLNELMNALLYLNVENFNL